MFRDGPATQETPSSPASIATTPTTVRHFNHRNPCLAYVLAYSTIYYLPGLPQHLPLQPLPIDLNGVVCGRPLPRGSFPQRSAVRRVAVGVVQRGRRAGAPETVLRLRLERVGADLPLHRRRLPGFRAQGERASTHTYTPRFVRRLQAK